jgi:hypothetical protein
MYSAVHFCLPTSGDLGDLKFDIQSQVIPTQLKPFYVNSNHLKYFGAANVFSHSYLPSLHGAECDADG